jgi:hypothetical protein
MQRLRQPLDRPTLAESSPAPSPIGSRRDGHRLVYRTQDAVHVEAPGFRSPISNWILEPRPL